MSGDYTQVQDELSMSADILWAMNHENVWSVKQTANLLHLSLSGAYRYYNKTELPYGYLRQFIHYAPYEAAIRLLNGLTRGTPYQFIYINADLDFDGDGDVDKDDVLAHTIESLDAMSSLFREAHSNGGGKVPDLDVLSELCQRVIHGVVTAERAAVFVHENQTKPRRARTVTAGGGR